MYYLYILKNSAGTRHYIGITADIGKRVAKHNAGGVRSTRTYRPWEVTYSENFPDRKAARLQEKLLKKNAKARKELFEKIDMASSSSLA